MFDIVIIINTLIFLQINNLPRLLIIQYFHRRSIFLRGRGKEGEWGGMEGVTNVDSSDGLTKGCAKNQ